MGFRAESRRYNDKRSNSYLLQTSEGLSPSLQAEISSYISALVTEIKLSDKYRQTILNTLIPLSRVKTPPSKSFRDFTRADVLRYLDNFRKSDEEDRQHKWIGTWNTNLVNVVRFFEWLYNQDLEPSKRPKPAVVSNLHKFRRREISAYKASDMWTPEEHLIFLKYCPSVRDRCYHAIQVDIGARPHEVLNLKIKDLEFMDVGEHRYARIVVNGKTGERALALIDSIPFVAQWRSVHPQGTNREAFLIAGKKGKPIQRDTMLNNYKDYKRHFSSLLGTNIPEEDKQKIRKLLTKPWNLYVQRHSAITEKSSILGTDSKLRQYAGWSVGSTMNRRYQHFSGGESMNDLLKAKGILPETTPTTNILQPKPCPHCREPNRPDSQFCFKCNAVMSFEAYNKGIEEQERKDQEIQQLKESTVEQDHRIESLQEQMKKLAETFTNYDAAIIRWSDRLHKETGIPGPLTKVEWEKLEYFSKVLADEEKEEKDTGWVQAED